MCVTGACVGGALCTGRASRRSQGDGEDGVQHGGAQGHDYILLLGSRGQTNVSSVLNHGFENKRLYKTHNDELAYPALYPEDTRSIRIHVSGGFCFFKAWP